MLQSYQMFGTLYIVATPIGNLGDMTQRGIETLKAVDLILAEDTRVTNILLRHYKIDKPLWSYHQQSFRARRDEVLLRLLQGRNIALVTDAGTPGISDPGNELIEYLLLREPSIKIEPIPGPSSVTAALSICGMNVSKFSFWGFLPKNERRKLIGKVIEHKMPAVFFESPYRIVKTLDWLINYLGGDKKVFIGQELTKLHERTIRGTLAQAKEILEAEQKEAGRVRGEIVVVLYL